MTELSDYDIQLLYKSIVLIDEASELKANETVTKETKAPHPKAQEAGQLIQEIKENVQDVTPEPPEEVKNPYVSFEFALVTPQSIKIALLAAGSNFDKIANAIGLSHLIKCHISIEELDQVEYIKDCKAVLGIGLDSEQQAKLNSYQGPCLFTTNPEVLQTPADKRAMFEPLKAFAPSLQS